MSSLLIYYFSRRADLDQINKINPSPLFLVADEGCQEIVHMLLDAELDSGKRQSSAILMLGGSYLDAQITRSIVVMKHFLR